MAKKPKDKPRARKLKVFRTPIGFHDAYVAAPSRKAALESWGADGNLFAQGIAEQVTDEKLMEEPLARPGEVIRKARGSAEEHLAAASEEERRRPARTSPLPTTGRGAKKKPKPGRHELEAAEQALEKAEKKQRKALARIDDRIQELERERRELQRRQEQDRDRLSGEVERARSAYRRAIREWDGS